MLDIIATFPFGRNFALLAKNYFGVLSKLLADSEVERYYSILILLDKSKELCTQQFICEQLQIDKVSMVRMIDHLIKKGLVNRVRNEQDRREYFIVPTAKSKKAMPELYAAVAQVNKAALKGISKAEQKILFKNIELIQTNLSSLPSEIVYINYKKASKKV